MVICLSKTYKQLQFQGLELEKKPRINQYLCFCFLLLLVIKRASFLFSVCFISNKQTVSLSFRADLQTSVQPVNNPNATNQKEHLIAFSCSPKLQDWLCFLSKITCSCYFSGLFSCNNITVVGLHLQGVFLTGLTKIQFSVMSSFSRHKT